MHTPHFILYGREDCHLCHDMHEQLRLWQTRYRFSFEMIDIEDDNTLQKRYGHMIPVLTKAGDVIVCYGRLSESFEEHLK